MSRNEGENGANRWQSLPPPVWKRRFDQSRWEDSPRLLFGKRNSFGDDFSGYFRLPHHRPLSEEWGSKRQMPILPKG